ncbi:hypothetical protein Tco_0064459 [Tanacetum coccineum]
MATNEETNTAGTDTRPPMLVENDYESWKIRIHRYIRGKPNGKLIWKSIQNGPTPHPMVTDPSPSDSTIMPAPRKKLDSEFNEEENKLEMADTQAEIILSQGLPRHIFNNKGRKICIIKERTTQKPDYVSEWCYDYAKQFVEQQLCLPMQFLKLTRLRQQLQGKDDTIRNLDAQINIMKVLNVGSTEGSCDQQALDTDRIQLKDTITSLRIQLDGLKVEN